MSAFVGIIPSRYQSSRFPGKPLADIAGKPMIQRVYERVKKVLDSVVVATDDKRIFKVVKEFGGIAIMTSASHRTGTERCAEALVKFETIASKIFDVVINIQGDEPFIKKEQIELLMSNFDNGNTQIATLIKPIENKEILFDTNRPKVVIDKQGFAMYFSRLPIPHLRNAEECNWQKKHTYFQHIGMYAYKRDVLKEIAKLQPTILEKAESLEQLRWLENGYKIKTAVTEYDSYGIDIPEDIENAIRMGFV
ncbi:MAG: 3-deoxy-manno-octulosonate cytidylyltransferase [Bacteroidales bacterium]|nr:3-deoxy-manno-octulosonate cytidylyltransferase [Bacteroidales bacterium]